MCLDVDDRSLHGREQNCAFRVLVTHGVPLELSEYICVSFLIKVLCRLEDRSFIDTSSNANQKYILHTFYFFISFLPM